MSFIDLADAKLPKQFHFFSVVTFLQEGSLGPRKCGGFSITPAAHSCPGYR